MTSASRYQPCYQSRSMMYIGGLIPRNFAKLAEAVPIAFMVDHRLIQVAVHSFARMTLGKILNIKGYGCMSLFALNLMKQFWLASGRVLASSEKKAFCQSHLTLLCLFERKYATL